jgi:SHS2 domain-containing protein
LKEIKIEGESLERLMVDWLNELLYLHEVEVFFLRIYVESVGENGLTARVKGAFSRGRPCDQDGVKAVTHHQIEVRRRMTTGGLKLFWTFSQVSSSR